MKNLVEITLTVGSYKLRSKCYDFFHEKIKKKYKTNIHKDYYATQEKVRVLKKVLSK